VTLDLRHSGEALRAVAGDLARVWRASRYVGEATAFPGFLDGVVEEFLERVAEAMLLGRSPEEAWSSTRGVVRIPPAGRASAELLAEWRLAGEVLRSACEALQVVREAALGAERAVSVAMEGVDHLVASRGPPGILAVRQLGGFRPRGGSRSDGLP